MTPKKGLKPKISKNELEAKLKRALADYDNLEKRVLAYRQDLADSARIEIIDKFLAVLDDLERAEDHLKNKGLSLALNQFRAVLQSEGVAEIQAQGKTFDPEKMDCVSLVKGKKNKVVKIIQKGFILKDKVIRPAKVEVGKGVKNV